MDKKPDLNEALDVLRRPPWLVVPDVWAEASAALANAVVIERETWQEALKIIERAGIKCGYLGREFTGPRFTDRGGDGPDLLEIEDVCDAFLEKSGA